jgi:hypothetical protein
LVVIYPQYCHVLHLRSLGSSAEREGKTKVFIKPLALKEGWAGERTGLALLLSQKKRGKIALSFASPEKEFVFYIYDVITWENFHKLCRLYYSTPLGGLVARERPTVGEDKGHSKKMGANASRPKWATLQEGDWVR